MGTGLRRARVTPATLLRAAALVALALGLYFFVRGLDGRVLLGALQGAALLPLALAALASFSTLFWKALSWRVMLLPRHPVPVLRLFRYTIAAFAGSLLLPARAGEALRLWLVHRRDGVPLAAVGGVALSEKLVDGMAMIVTVSPALLLLEGLPPWVGRSVLLLVGGALACVALLFAVRRRARPGGLLGKLAAGMTAFASPRVFALTLGVCLCSWLADYTSVLLCLDAVGAHVGPAVGLLVLLGVNVAILVPTTPGNLGALEIGAAAALDLVGVPRPTALAFGILYHAVQALPLLAVGLLDVRFALDASRQAAADAAPTTDEDEPAAA
jgi:uncharacterized membrane protein YbhN (UPF0104 family)